MKLLLGTTLLFLAACGDLGGHQPSNIGDLRSLTPETLSAGNTANIISICQSIAQKDASSLINNSYVFGTSSKACDRSEFNSEVNISTTIQNTSNGLRFVDSQNNLLIFPELETTSEGSLAAICRSLTNNQISSPIIEGDKFTYFTTQGISSADCNPRADELCIEIQRAVPNGSGSALVQSKEWIRFNISLTEGRRGFWTFKKSLGKGDCPVDQVRGRRAELK